tara:strand:+ start:139 stop:342 length:204 start_codon:yes stop_codon:yes gene_type:complete
MNLLQLEALQNQDCQNKRQTAHDCPRAVVTGFAQAIRQESFEDLASWVEELVSVTDMVDYLEAIGQQ